MPRLESQEPQGPRFEHDMHRLEQGMHLLKAEFNRYFVGDLETPPYELQCEMEALIRRQREGSQLLGRNTAEQFRFNTLLANFRSLTEMWNRNIRRFEEGRPTKVVKRAADHTAGRPAANGEEVLCRAQVNGETPSPQDGSLKNLYSSFLNAVRESGSDKARLSYKNFYEQIDRHAQKYRQRTGAKKLVFRLVLVDNRPILKLGSEND